MTYYIVGIGAEREGLGRFCFVELTYISVFLEIVFGAYKTWK